ncbi:MAG: glycosyltransferase family protein, partial [Pseudorhodoplanes sp.]|nr:glycosyltransferase family protein [Pseudorhodoplanes sp.]
MARVIGSIEARMKSTRLPGKVLIDIEGAPALTRLLRRMRRARSLDGIVLATTDTPADDSLVAWAKNENVDFYRGSEDDVLARVVGAHRQMNTDIIVEVCGDCPLIDPDIIDMAVATFNSNDVDVVTTTARQLVPQGADAQVFRFNALAEVERTVFDSAVREHVSLYFYEHPERYRIAHLVPPSRWCRPEQRLQLDYPEDLVFIRAVYQRLLPAHGDAFGLDDILALLKKYPSLAAI